MRKTVISLLTVTLLCGPAWSDGPAADQIRDLYRTLQHDRVLISARADILDRAEQIHVRRASGGADPVVPGPGVKGGSREGTQAGDTVMDPVILEAISDMPVEKAASLLRVIGGGQAGIARLESIPSLSFSDGMSHRDGQDRFFVPAPGPNVTHATSGPWKPDAFRIALEGGDGVPGGGRGIDTISLGADPVDNIAGQETVTGFPQDLNGPRIIVPVIEGNIPDDVVRPRPRPANLRPSEPGSLAPLTSPRPKPRPADLMSKYRPAVEDVSSGPYAPPPGEMQEELETAP